MSDSLEWEWFWPALNAALKIDSSVITLLSGHRQLDNQHEKGGQLFMDITNNDGLTLIEITPPHPNDRSGKTWLELDKQRCKDEVKSANAKGLKLIGFWHTHPELVPNLSPQDKKSLIDFSKENSSILPNPIAIIVGQSHAPDGIRAWSLQSNTFLLAERRILQRH